MVKTFYKTGSLFANSCKSVAMLSGEFHHSFCLITRRDIAGCDEAAQHLATEFGRNLGLAFQVVDDVLDYVASAAELGKPTATDLRLGLATCPVSQMLIDMQLGNFC
jgi:decaprenyl-diphosphate synthase subunit 1